MRTPTRRLLVIAAGALLGLSTLAAVGSPASAAPQVSTASDGLVDLTVTYSESTVEPGDEVTATLQFDNNSGDTGNYAYDIGGSTQPLNDVLDFDSCDLPPGLNVNCIVGGGGSSFLVSIIDLPLGSTTIVAHFTVVPELAVGTYSFEHQLLGEDINLLDPEVSFTVLPPAADLGVALSAASVPLASRINYTLSVANNGPDDSTGSTVTVQLPAPTNSVSGLDSACSYSSATDVVTCAVPGITNGSSRQFSIQANLGLLSLGALNATATRTASTPADPVSANDTATANCTALTSLLVSCP